MTIIIPRNPVSLFSIIAAGIAIIVLVSFSGPGGTVTVATVTAHPLDGGVEKKNEVVMVMANNNKKAKGKMCSCTDLKNCKKCLGKGTDCAWKLTTTTTTTGNDNDSASSSSPLSSSPLSSSCVDKENCEEEEGSSCVTAESKESAEYVCGLNCGGAANNNVVQKEGGNNTNNNNGCDECLASSQQGGIDCSWYVDNNNNNGGGGGSSKCIGKLQCKDKGFETGSCINPPKKKKKKKKKKKTTTTTCASINGNCFKKTSCKQCLNYNKGGANCAWWVSTDGTTTKCIGAEICNNGKMINGGGGGGGGGGDSKKKFGNCTVRDAFATKSSNKETCTALKDVDVDVVDDNNNNNNNNGSSCAEDDDETKCQNIANCNDCFDTEGCGWKQCKTLLFGESDGDDDDDESTCGFDSWGCYPRKDSRAATAATATATADFFCPVLPSCGETFPDLVGKTVKEAFLFFIKTYGKGYLCLPIVVEGSFVTEDFRCDRIRLWVDKKTQTTIVAEPRVG